MIGQLARDGDVVVYVPDLSLHCYEAVEGAGKVDTEVAEYSHRGQIERGTGEDGCVLSTVGWS